MEQPSSLLDLVAKSRHIIYVRATFATLALILGLAILKWISTPLDPAAMTLVCIVVMVCNLVALLFLSKGRFSEPGLKILNAALLGVDIAALSAFVHFTRGLESDLFFLYLVPTLLASNVFERTGIFVTALCCSFAYPAVLIFDNLQLLLTAREGLAGAYAQQVSMHIVGRSIMLFAVSMIWALFCHRVSRVAQESMLRLEEQLFANTKLVDEIKAQSQREQMSSSISLALRRTLELDEILQTACNHLSAALGRCHCVFVSQIAHQGGTTRVWSSGSAAAGDDAGGTSAGQEQVPDRFELPERLREFFVNHRWRREEGMSGVVLPKFVIGDAPFTQPDFEEIRHDLADLNVATLLARPIMYGGFPKGVLAAFAQGEVRIWTLAELELIDSVAGQLALAVEHAQLVEELSRRNRELVGKNANLDAKNLELRQVQSQLVHHEKMASLGRIVAGIAHELNNPINFVHGNLPYLKEYFQELKSLVECADAVPSEYKSELDALKHKINYDFLVTDLDNIIADLTDGAERIREIVRNLRSFSRLDEAELKEASIREGLESTVKILSQYYGRDKIPVQTDFCEMPPVLCYPGKLNQVWMNLLSNAAQAAGEAAEPKVSVKTTLKGDRVLVSVADNGPGIKPEDQSKIFEPFFTTKPVGKGTGLGLSICHSIIEGHGGRIWFESTPGEGTSFMVELPLRVEETTEVALVEADLPATQV